MVAKSKRPYRLPDALVCDPAEVAKGVSLSLVRKYIDKHQKRMQRYRYLEKLYKGFHDVFNAPEKEEWKPDNRLAVNFPRYITETFLGYGYGIPIKKTHDDEQIQDAGYAKEKITADSAEPKSIDELRELGLRVHGQRDHGP